jgi:hypothetical protein
MFKLWKVTPKVVFLNVESFLLPTMKAHRHGQSVTEPVYFGPGPQEFEMPGICPPFILEKPHFSVQVAPNFCAKMHKLNLQAA